MKNIILTSMTFVLATTIAFAEEQKPVDVTATTPVAATPAEVNAPAETKEVKKEEVTPIVKTEEKTENDTKKEEEKAKQEAEAKKAQEEAEREMKELEDFFKTLSTASAADTANSTQQ